MTLCKCLLLAIGCVLIVNLARSRGDENKKEHGFVERVYKDEGGKEFKYVLFVPYAYQGDKAYPIILFLHGAGEREGGSKGPADVGIGPAIKKTGAKDFPFFVVFPRCQRAPHNWRADGPDSQRALAMLAEVMKAYSIDEKRVYLTGLSMGGYGTWDLAAKYPHRWAAIVPICGGGDPSGAEKIKHIPCWCFHGDADPAVKVEKSRSMIKALQEAGGKPKYTEYAGVGHNSWDKAYGTRELYDWLFKHSLKTRPGAGH
jgi:predicted peptidase